MAAFRVGLIKQISRGMFRCEERMRPSERCINSVQLLGRVGQFPKKGKGDVWRFPLATSHKFQGKDEFGENKLMQKTQWHNIAVFRPYLQQKVQEMISKGSRVLVHGRLEYVSYDDEDGSRKSFSSIVMDDVILLSSPEERNSLENEEEMEFEEMS
ncbi:single-stranded DNA-binding protein, mitochondrial-like [Xenia sp. Carnegie-2017]|uniref:single-stranded DNA-binding protein, mitochondrial-like n=1 Tax=Xenia sp. Carnegie-2017 TaxID=2897299 RepID=UPI001F03694E|nr:single-stranded DNA-binding protein, mitochondrial-like [Xenia sp. Carnegie-2017]